MKTILIATTALLLVSACGKPHKLPVEAPAELAPQSRTLADEKLIPPVKPEISEQKQDALREATFNVVNEQIAPTWNDYEARDGEVDMKEVRGEKHRIDRMRKWVETTVHVPDYKLSYLDTLDYYAKEASAAEHELTTHALRDAKLREEAERRALVNKFARELPRPPASQEVNSVSASSNSYAEALGGNSRTFAAVENGTDEASKTLLSRYPPETHAVICSVPAVTGNVESQSCSEPLIWKDAVRMFREDQIGSLTPEIMYVEGSKEYDKVAK